MAKKQIVAAGREQFGETTYIQNASLKAGDTFTGIFKKARQEQYENDDGKTVTKNTYYLKQADGSEIGLNGCQSLDELMALVSPGSSIDVVFKGRGKAKKGRRAPYLFDVFADEPAAAEAPAAEPLSKVKKSA